MKKLFLGIIFALMLMSLVIAAENADSRSNTLKKAEVLDDIWMDANRMNGVFRNNGVWYYDYIAGDWGLEWPKGSGLSPIFAGGQYISARVDGEIRVAGVQHSATEFQPGEIVEPGVATNPRAPEYQWYVLEPGGAGDWANWPVNQGAPVDADGNPMLIGDKTAFSVWNDLADHAEYGTNKLSAEVKQLVWQFNRADALGDMTFIKWTITNKSGVAWDSTYLSIWSDPDLGGATDDFVGSDPELGLGYCYNATNDDQNYGAAPPAVGIDFFQGPLVDSPGDAVHLPDGSMIQDKKMIGMTSFIFYNNDDSPQGNPHTGQHVWNYQRGYWQDNSPILAPDGSKDPFMYNGDPETGNGWLDSNEADRRFLMTTGPFKMEAWVDENGDGLPQFGEPGVQEIVAGIIVARGSSNLNSVTKLKTIDELAQKAYDLNFILAKAPASPVVDVSENSNSVLLTWGDTSEFNEDGSPYESVDPIVKEAVGDTVIMDNTVKVVDDDAYDFYGYSVYQYSDASGADPVLVQSWNNGGDSHALDYEGARHILLAENKHSMVGAVGDKLINGKEYYFGVVAEGYLEFGAPQVFDSPPTIIAVTPHMVPGQRLTSAMGDTLEVTKVGESDGSAVALVIDPSRTTGQDYSVTFNDGGTWNLVRDDGVVLADSLANQTGNEAYNVYDGIQVKVVGPDPGVNTGILGPFGDYPGPSGYNGWNFDGARWLSWGPFDWGLGTWGGTFGDAGLFFGTTITSADYVNTRLEFAGADMATEPERWSKAAVYWRHEGYAFKGMGDFPAAAYDISDPDNPRRLNICFVEDNRYGWTVDPTILVEANMVWDCGWYSNGDTAAFADQSAREYFFINNSDYNPDGSVYNDVVDGTVQDAMWAGLVGPRGDHPYLEGQWWMEIYASKVNSPAVTYEFSAPAATAATTASLKDDIKNVNVVPNPYYGYHSGEMDPFDRWVQFTNLPNKVDIKIFDIAGNLVRTLEKDDEVTLMRWNMKNAYDLPVASGIYVCHIDAPGIGEKVLKLAIVAPNERLDTY